MNFPKWLVCLMLVAPSAFAASSKVDCETYLRDTHRPRYTFGKLQVIESLDFGDNLQVRGTIAGLFAEMIFKKSALPTTEQITSFILKHLTSGMSSRAEYDEEKGDGASRILPDFIWVALDKPANVIGTKGIFSSLTDLLSLIGKEYPDLYTALRGKIQKQALLFFRHRLRPPTFRELSAVLKFEDQQLLQAIVSEPGFWDEALFSDIGRHVDYARKRIKTAYARSVRGTDTAAVKRTRKIQPTIRRLIETMILTKSNEHYQWRAFQGDYGRFSFFNSRKHLRSEQVEALLDSLGAELEAMLGLRKLDHKGKDVLDRWVFNMPVLFPGGIDELHVLARAEYQATFTSYEDKIKFPLAYAESIRQKIVKAPGILVSTIIPGLKVDWEMLDGMIKMSKQKGYPLILIPADGMLQDLDQKVLSHPDIDILTASIENEEFLLALYPSNMRSLPFAPFKKPGMFKIGQQIIVPHHILAHESIPTAHNSQNQTQLFSTGVVNTPEIPGVGKHQKAKAYRTSKEIKQSFLIAEKVDKGTDNEFGGATNHWHIRPVEFRKGAGTEPSLIVDNNSAYIIQRLGDGQFRVDRKRLPVVQLYLPDVHFITANPRVMTAIKDYMKRMLDKGVQVTLVLPDPVDSKSINHHVEKKQTNRDALNRLLTTGEINFEDEINETIGNINVLLNEFPGVNIVFQYSNHSDEWIERNLFNAPSWLQLVANGPLIEEMRFACRTNGWTPLEYLLLHREGFLKRTSMDGSDKYKDGVVFVSDPSRVRTMRAGEPISTAADGWEVYLQHHGHAGANGGRSSFKTHAMGEKRSITGDAHRMGFEGRGENFWVGVGSTAFDQPYTRLGYSSWGVGMAIVSPYNTMQLLQWDPYTGSFLQRHELGLLEGEEFFGGDPLRVVGAMDDDERRQRQDGEEFLQWFGKQSEWIEAGRLKAPKP